jgi:hypothetical protein
MSMDSAQSISRFIVEQVDQIVKTYQEKNP